MLAASRMALARAVGVHVRSCWSPQESTGCAWELGDVGVGLSDGLELCRGFVRWSRAVQVRGKGAGAEEQLGLLQVITAGPKRGLAGSSHSCMGKGCKCVLVLGMGMVYGLAAVAWSW